MFNCESVVFNPEAVRTLRLALYLEQAEFGKLILVTGSAICSWERGKRQPRLSSIRRMIGLAKENKIKMSFDDFFKLKEPLVAIEEDPNKAT